MGDEGFIFIPDRCSNGANECHLHVHFHGCGMEKGWLGDGYVQRTGFLPLAQTNDIVMIFPQVNIEIEFKKNMMDLLKSQEEILFF